LVNKRLAGAWLTSKQDNCRMVAMGTVKPFCDLWKKKQ